MASNFGLTPMEMDVDMDLDANEGLNFFPHGEREPEKAGPIETLTRFLSSRGLPPIPFLHEGEAALLLSQKAKGNLEPFLDAYRCYSSALEKAPPEVRRDFPRSEITRQNLAGYPSHLRELAGYMVRGLRLIPYQESLDVTERQDVGWAVPSGAKVLGTGGFGVCKEGLLRAGNEYKRIAVKQIERRDIEKDLSLTEVYILMCLTHKNIVGFLGFHQDPYHTFILMELIDGGSLSSFLATRKKNSLWCSNLRLAPPLGVVRQLLRQIVEALAFIHGKGVLHGDLKAANIMVCPSGEIKIIDFGISQMLRADLTQEGEFTKKQGTPSHVAPEVREGRDYGRKSDIWSLGCLCLEIITCAPVAPKHLPGWEELIPKGTSKDLIDLVRQCLREDPDQRPSAKALLDFPFCLVDTGSLCCQPEAITGRCGEM